MPNFGFSAYLKIVSLNPKPQRRELKVRVFPSGDGYDFHKSLHKYIQRIVADPSSIVAVLESIKSIVQAPERKSAREGVAKFIKWRSVNSGATVQLNKRTYQSPNGTFSVNFVPDFGIKMDGNNLAVHIWNTAIPALSNQSVQNALGLFHEAYGSDTKVAVLSLQTSELFVFDGSQQSVTTAKLMANRIELEMEKISDEGKAPIVGIVLPPAPPSPPF